MTKSTENNEDHLEHLEWLVKNRSRTQATSLALFRIIATYKEVLQSHKLDYGTSQELVAVAFSLWRGVFLADKSGVRWSSLNDATAFLGTLLTDNAINYPLDRATSNWTFNFYAATANYHLETVRKTFSDIFPPNTGLPDQAKPRWEYLQKGFETAVAQFGEKLAASK